MLKKLQEQMDKQTTNITDAVTNKLTAHIQEQLKPLLQENAKLKSEVTKLQTRVNFFETEKRSNNLIFFGIDEGKEERKPIHVLLQHIIQEQMKIKIEGIEINKAYRLGKKGDKPRPIMASFVTNWKKSEIFRNRKELLEPIYIKEDYSKEVLEKRKQLLPKLEEERNKGNVAYLKYDKIVVKEPRSSSRDKRKRVDSISPPQPIVGTTAAPRKGAPKKISKTNIYEYMNRERSHSLSEVTKN